MTFFNRVYAMVKKIPKGKVATYGQIAALVGSPRAARQVGWALHMIDGTSKLHGVPWQRVVNRYGMISTTCLEHPPEEQARLLVQEGITVMEKEGNYVINLDIYLWQKRKSR